MFARVLTVWERPVNGVQTERAYMLELCVLMPLKAFVTVKLFTCLSARLCRSIVDLEIGGKFLPGFRRGRSGSSFAGQGGLNISSS